MEGIEDLGSIFFHLVVLFMGIVVLWTAILSLQRFCLKNIYHREGTDVVKTFVICICMLIALFVCRVLM